MHYFPAKLSDLTGAEEEIDCEVMTQLYLMCPDMLKKDVDIILVNEENVALCLDLWEKSFVFKFGHAFQVMIKDGIKVKPRKSL